MDTMHCCTKLPYDFWYYGLNNSYYINQYPYQYPYYTAPVYYQSYYPQNPNQFPSHSDPNNSRYRLRDYGPEPYVVNIEEITEQNDNFRLALWTGEHFQATLMSIGVGEDIGLELHEDTDQFFRIEQGQGIVRMGDTPDNLDFQAYVYEDYAIFVPAGKWHNLINTGNVPIKLYSIYAPPHHPHGTIHRTKKDAQ
jgi:mannose-6-phosphate isomerase-like protein (cupin superfamily)